MSEDGEYDGNVCTLGKMENNEIMWFIPMSSKIDKYKAIVKDKIKKYYRNISRSC